MTAPDKDEFSRYAGGARPMLWRAAYRLTGDRDEADDLAQRTLIALLGQWETLRDRERLGAYAHTTLLRLLIDDRRSRRWTSEILQERPPEPEPVPDGGATAADRLLVREALAALTPRQRSVVVLRYWEDRSVEETARALGLMRSTVRSQSARALARLRVLLGPALENGNGEDAGGRSPSGR